VLNEGTAPIAGPITVLTRDPLEVSVAMAFAAARGDLAQDDVERVNDHPALAEAWRR
jgi:MOSC domain-containing protein YiiM